MQARTVQAPRCRCALTSRWLLAGMAALATLAAQAMPPELTLHYYERPPYLLREPDGTARGLTADPVRAAIKHAKLNVHWQLTPARRQLSLISHNSGYDCGIGWFRNAEREAFAQFSVPIYRDQPPVLILNRRIEHQHINSVAALLANPDLRVLIKDGLTYGSYLAERAAQARAHIETVSIEQPQLIRMVAAGRADVMFATAEEAQLLVTSYESGDAAVKVVRFPDIPNGEFRYLMCSRNIDADTMQRINDAIKATSSVQ